MTSTTRMMIATLTAPVLLLAGVAAALVVVWRCRGRQESGRG